MNMYFSCIITELTLSYPSGNQNQSILMVCTVYDIKKPVTNICKLKPVSSNLSRCASMRGYISLSMSLDPHSEMRLCTSAGAVQVIGTAHIYRRTCLAIVHISSVKLNIRMCVVSHISVINTVNTPRVAVDDDDVLLMHAGCWGTE